MVLKAKHIVEEIGGQRCTVVEKGIEKKRVDFLKKLLQHNQFEVVVDEVAQTEESTVQLFNMGVTDLVFNPVIAVFEMALKTDKGEVVTAAYWNQESTESVKEYWLMAK
jgi:predicted transcriptional regulator YheO